MRLHRWWGFVLFCFLSTWYKLDDVVWRGCFLLTTRLSSTGGVTRAEVQNRGILNCSACRGEISLEMGGEERKIRTSWKLAECGKRCMVWGLRGARVTERSLEMGFPPALKSECTSPMIDICFKLGGTWAVESSFYLQEALGLSHTNKTNDTSFCYHSFSNILFIY